jgi:hypothetical protein
MKHEESFAITCNKCGARVIVSDDNIKGDSDLIAFNGDVCHNVYISCDCGNDVTIY